MTKSYHNLTVLTGIFLFQFIYVSHSIPLKQIDSRYAIPHDSKSTVPNHLNERKGTLFGLYRRPLHPTPEADLLPKRSSHIKDGASSIEGLPTSLPVIPGLNQNKEGENKKQFNLKVVPAFCPGEKRNCLRRHRCDIYIFRADRPRRSPPARQIQRCRRDCGLKAGVCI